MSNRTDLLTPVGRLVLGSLYEGQTTDLENRPLTTKSGPNAGQPRTNYFFAVAIPKGSEQHWNQTEWGQKVWEVANRSFVRGETQAPTFAWKIKDGDSQIPNKNGRRPCDLEGHPGHWILSFSSGFPPAVYTDCGRKQMVEKDAVNLGDYVEVFGSVDGNGSNQQPGVFLNHSMVNFVGYGERIFVGQDPKAVGFTGSLPPGASHTPKQSGFNPSTSIQNAGYNTVASTAMAQGHTNHTTLNTPAPHYGILQPPAASATSPAAPQKVMLAAAGSNTYEDYIKAGWNDALLIQHGFMAP